MEIAKAFLKKSKPFPSTLNGRKITTGKHGSPFLEEAAASLECKVVYNMRMGDHVMFVGEVIDGAGSSGDDILTLRETGWKYNR